MFKNKRSKQGEPDTGKSTKVWIWSVECSIDRIMKENGFQDTKCQCRDFVMEEINCIVKKYNDSRPLRFPETLNYLNDRGHLKVGSLKSTCKLIVNLFHHECLHQQISNRLREHERIHNLQN